MILKKINTVLMPVTFFGYGVISLITGEWMALNGLIFGFIYGMHVIDRMHDKARGR